MVMGGDCDNVSDLGKIIVATSFEWLPKVQKIANSGHTDCYGKNEHKNGVVE